MSGFHIDELAWIAWASLLLGCTSPPQRSTAAVRFDPGTRKEIAHDVHALLDQGLPVAVTMLQDSGSFLPFGGVVYADGGVEGFGPRREAATRDAGEVHRLLQEALQRAAADERIVASAIFSNGAATLPKEAHEVPAIRIEVEHQDGYAADLVVPYRVTQDEVTLRDVLARPRRAVVFTEGEGARR